MSAGRKGTDRTAWTALSLMPEHATSARVGGSKLVNNASKYVCKHHNANVNRAKPTCSTSK